MKTEIYNKAHKLLRLAEQGDDNERENARQALDKLLFTHGYSMQDMQEQSKAIIELEVAVNDEWEAKLASHVAYKFDCDVFLYKKARSQKRKNARFIRGTSESVASFSLFFEAYKDSMAKELLSTYIAFVHRNKIFKPQERTEDGDSERELTEIELMAVRKMSTMDMIHVQNRLTR